MVIGIKPKASLKVTFRTSREVFDEHVDIVLDADSKEEAEAQLGILMHRWKWTTFELHRCITWGGGQAGLASCGRKGIKRQAVKKVIPIMTNALGALLLGAAILVAGCAKPKPCACEVPRAAGIGAAVRCVRRGSDGRVG